eukprot:2688277-Rhodomonas_salina.1
MDVQVHAIEACRIDPPAFVNLDSKICSKVVIMSTFAKTWTEIMFKVDKNLKVGHANLAGNKI